MIELHCHSTFSDGTLTPEELLAEAERAGLAALALTDHDTVAGLPRFLAAAAGGTVRAIPGIELSADIEVGALHLLGYFVDAARIEADGTLERLRRSREERNTRILTRLAEMGVPVTLDDVRAATVDGVLGRPHIADALIRRGHARDRREVFERWLAKDRPAYIERERLSPDGAIALVRAAGGVPVLAHPASLKRGQTGLRELLGGLRSAGLEGMETQVPDQDPVHARRLRRLAREFDLVATGGSDYHGERSPGIRLGRGRGDMLVADEVLQALENRRPGIQIAGALPPGAGDGGGRP